MSTSTAPTSLAKPFFIPIRLTLMVEILLVAPPGFWATAHFRIKRLPPLLARLASGLYRQVGQPRVGRQCTAFYQTLMAIRAKAIQQQWFLPAPTEIHCLPETKGQPTFSCQLCNLPALNYGSLEQVARSKTQLLEKLAIFAGTLAEHPGIGDVKYTVVGYVHTIEVDDSAQPTARFLDLLVSLTKLDIRVFKADEVIRLRVYD